MHIQDLLVRDNIEIIEQKKNSKNVSDSNNSKIHQKHFTSSLFRYPSLFELKSNTYYLLILLGINIIHSMQHSSEVKSVL